MQIPIECEIKDCHDTQEFEQAKKIPEWGKNINSDDRNIRFVDKNEDMLTFVVPDCKFHVS